MCVPQLMMHVRLERLDARPVNKWRSMSFTVVTFHGFDNFIIGCIVGNAVVMAMPYWGMSDSYAEFCDTADYVFTGVFATEAALKMMAFGTNYFTGLCAHVGGVRACHGGLRVRVPVPWNRFDLTIVVAAIGGIIVSRLGVASVGTLASIVRLLRVGRCGRGAWRACFARRGLGTPSCDGTVCSVIRLIRSARSLRIMFNTLIVTLPSLGVRYASGGGRGRH